MGSLEHLCLRWNEYESNFKQGFSDLRENEELFDVTLISGSKIIKAHKVILSACSPIFRSIIASAPIQTHPLIYLRGINFDHLELLLSFMYHGEVKVIQEELEDFISIAEEFQIKGLSNDAPPPKKRRESQPSTSTASTYTTPSYLPPDSPDISIVKNDINEALPKSLPNTEDEECYILDESNDSELTQNYSQNESEQMEANHDALDISSDKNKEYIEALNKEISQHYTKQKTGKGYQCKKCEYSTSYGHVIRRHVESMHIITKGFVCTPCDRVFKTRNSLYSHEQKIHKRESVVFEGPKSS
uniref:Putative LOC100167818 [Acyrthosiphon pisum] n=1 Tax=Lepeophtheirus salmonis TaxID=72036 RepID=A0A0K2UUW5_LEPSM